MSYSYHKILKYLYFEGYADSYAEAESLLSEMNESEIDELLSLCEDDYLTRSATAASQAAEQRKKEEKRRLALQQAAARATKERPSSDEVSIRGTSGGQPGKIVYNTKTKTRTFVPD